MILQIVTFVFLILFILVLMFHQTSRRSQKLSYRLEQREHARQIVEAAILEALQVLHHDVQDPSAELGRLFIAHQEGRKVPVSVPLSQALALRLFPPPAAPVVEVWARTIDFRSRDQDKRPYYRQEGVGRFVLQAKLDSRDRSAQDEPGKGKMFPRLELVRAYDFKIVSLVSAHSLTSRDRYAQNFIQDYALFIRHGYDEFKRKDALNLNNDKLRVEVIQGSDDSRYQGKIYLGTPQPSAPEKFVYLNIVDDWGAFLPTIGEANATQTWKKEVDADACARLFPSLKDLIAPSDSPWKNLKGVFEGQALPMNHLQKHPDDALAREVFAGLYYGAGPDSEENVFPGQHLLGADVGRARRRDAARSILEGAIRQRFFYCVRFHLDFSGIDPAIQETLPKERQYFPCLAKLPPGKTSPEAADFIRNLNDLAQENTQPGGSSPYLSRFDTDFLFEPDLTERQRLDPHSFFQQQFFAKDGSPVSPQDASTEGVHPYGHVNLWKQRFWEQKDLQTQGIIDGEAGIIRLNGIVWVKQGLVIERTRRMDQNAGASDGKAVALPMKITGRGVIISEGDIRIRSGIEKGYPGASCVFFTKNGKILVQTDQPVSAGLVAMGEQGGVIFSGAPAASPQRLLGFLATNRLDVTGLTRPMHLRIEYDPVFTGPEDRYAIHVIPKMYFQQYFEEGT